jgi:hypothetical protein
MKRLLLIVLPLLLMVGCEDKKDDTTNSLVGVYNLTSVSISIQSDPVETITLDHDGSNTYMVFILGDDDVFSLQGYLDGDAYSRGGTWSDTGNKLTLIQTDGDTHIWDYTLTGKKLVGILSLPETETTWGVIWTYDFTKD